MNTIQIHPSGWGFMEKSSNQPFTPWGCNYLDPSTGWPPHLWGQFDRGRVSEQMDQIRAIGGNIIRVFSTVKNVLCGPEQLNHTGIAKMEHMLSLAEAKGIRVIWSGPNLWEGTPDWWREQAPFESYAHPDLIAAMQTAWRGLGQVFRGHPALFAYELHGEPFAPWKPTPILNEQWQRWRKKHAPSAPDTLPAPIEPLNWAWHADLQRFREYLAAEYVQRMTEAIRGIDDTHLITIGLHQKSAPFDWYPPDPYSAFNPHHLAEFLDYTSIHFYPHHMYHPNLYHDPYETFDGMLDTFWHARAVLRYVYTSGKPVVLEECGWYGGGAVLIGNREQPPRTEAEQTTWCTGLLKATRGDACGWLFWLYRDTPASLDSSRYSGLYDASGRLKDWGSAFARLAPEITSGIPTREAGTKQISLPWEALVTDPEQIKRFRAVYLDAFKRGDIVDFEMH